MASILNVDQINNAAGTSGIALDASTGKASFPNSVTIPNGATMPAGSMVQFGSSVTKVASITNFNGVTGPTAIYGSFFANRTYTLANSVTITPKSTSSILYCVGIVGWTAMSATNTMAHGQIITRNDGQDSIDMSDYPWYQHSYITSSSLYYPAETISGVFTPASTSPQTIRLRPFVYIEGGNTATGSFKSSSLFVMEIAQ
jgi:hypothetical protein